MMDSEISCTHITTHTTICRFCGRPFCDLCWKKHESRHIADGDNEITFE